MNYTVYEGKEPVGEITIDPMGLYIRVACKIKARQYIRRIYGIHGTECTRLGIPDENGEFTRRIPAKYFSTPDRIIASSAEIGDWIPWSGDHFGPMVYDSLLCPDKEGWNLAIAPEEWESIPQWKQSGKQEIIGGRPMIRLYISSDRKLPAEVDVNREEEREVHSLSLEDDFDPLLLADLPADYDYGGVE